MEGGYSTIFSRTPSPVRLYGTIHKNIPGHDVWAPGAGWNRTQPARKSPAELRRSHTEKHSRAPQVPWCLHLCRVKPLASNVSCS